MKYSKYFAHSYTMNYDLAAREAVKWRDKLVHMGYVEGEDFGWTWSVNSNAVKFHVDDLKLITLMLLQE